MDNVSRYGYINAKLRARIGQMHSSTLIDSMIKAANLPEALGHLAGTNYARLLDAYEKSGDLQMVELELFKEEIEVQRDIIACLDGRAGGFVSVLLEKTEIENIKNAMRLWYSANIMHHSISYRSAYIYREKIVNNIDWLKIVNAIDYKGVLSAFRETPYFEVFSRYNDQKLVKEGLFQLEIDLDHEWFRMLFAAADHLVGEDRTVARRIYEVDVDLKNILNLIRYGYYYSYSASDLAFIFLPYGSLYDQLEGRIKAGGLSLSDARDIVKRKYPRVSEMLEKMNRDDRIRTNHRDLVYDTLQIENYLAQKRKKEFSQMLTADPFTIGVTLSYIYLFKNTNSMIRSVLTAKYYNWDEEQIRRELN